MTIDVPGTRVVTPGRAVQQYEGVRTNAGRLAETAESAKVAFELGLVVEP